MYVLQVTPAKRRSIIHVPGKSPAEPPCGHATIGNIVSTVLPLQDKLCLETIGNIPTTSVAALSEALLRARAWHEYKTWQSSQTAGRSEGSEFGSVATQSAARAAALKPDDGLAPSEQPRPAASRNCTRAPGFGSAAPRKRAAVSPSEQESMSAPPQPPPPLSPSYAPPPPSEHSSIPVGAAGVSGEPMKEVQGLTSQIAAGDFAEGSWAYFVMGVIAGAFLGVFAFCFLCCSCECCTMCGPMRQSDGNRKKYMWGAIAGLLVPVIFWTIIIVVAAASNSKTCITDPFSGTKVCK